MQYILPPVDGWPSSDDISSDPDAEMDDASSSDTDDESIDHARPMASSWDEAIARDTNLLHCARLTEFKPFQNVTSSRYAYAAKNKVIVGIMYDPHPNVRKWKFLVYDEDLQNITTCFADQLR